MSEHTKFYFFYRSTLGKNYPVKSTADPRAKGYEGTKEQGIGTVYEISEEEFRTKSFTELTKEYPNIV